MSRSQNGAHDRDRTGEPLPYQGSALPTELRGQCKVFLIGAGNGIRTRDPQLGRLTL